MWRKLRDGHRQAISRKKTTTGQAANSKNLWKYEKFMEFLLPTMQNRSRSTNVNTQDSNEQESDIIQQNENPSESGQHEMVDDCVPPKKKPNLTSLIEKEQKRREIRSAERDSLRRQILCNASKNTNNVESTALGNFFMSMLQTTSVLPENLQLRVQRQVFNIVMEAKEEDIVTRPHSIASTGSSLSAPSPASALGNAVHHFRGDSPFLLRSPQYNTSPRATSTLSNYTDITSSPQHGTQRNDIEHEENYSSQDLAAIENNTPNYNTSSQIDIRSYIENENFSFN